VNRNIKDIIRNCMEPSRSQWRALITTKDVANANNRICAKFLEA